MAKTHFAVPHHPEQAGASRTANLLVDRNLHDFTSYREGSENGRDRRTVT